MVATQSFRVLGKQDIEEITCEEMFGENVIYWEDIEQVFPGAKYVKNGTTTFNMMRDQSRKRFVPFCIRHCPGVVLDVVLSADPVVTSNSSGSHVQPSVLDSGTPVASASPFDDPPGTILTSPISLPPRPPSGSGITLNGVQPSDKTVPSMPCLESETDRRLYATWLPDIQAYTGSSLSLYRSLAHILWEEKMDQSEEFRRLLVLGLQGIRASIEQATELQRALKAERIRHFDQLIQIQKMLHSHKTYELHEHPTPRLFIVLPQDSRRWNSEDPFSNNFRLYFLCDCEEPTRGTNSRTSRRVHLAKHAGYDIARPKAFFQHFGSHIFTVLTILQFGAGVTDPVLSQLIRADAMDQENLRVQMDTVEPVDQVIECIERVLQDGSNVTVGLSGNDDPSEDVDLHKLETFLKQEESNVLGELYRVVTASGHHWVCVDHYREKYPEAHTKALADTAASLNGSFDEHTGRARVKLESREQAERFYLALEKVDAVWELNIDLHWDTTRSDFARLRDALTKIHVGILELDLNIKSDLYKFFPNSRHDPIFDIMRHSSLRSVAIISPPDDFIQRSHLLSSNHDFPNLRHLDLDIGDLATGMPGFMSLIAKAPHLSSLILCTLETTIRLVFDGEHPVCSAFHTAARILPPGSESPQLWTDFKDLTELFQVLGGRIERLELGRNDLNESTIAALVQATENGSSLKEFVLEDCDQGLGDKCIGDMASIIARSALRKLDIYLAEEDERVRALESIQWKHIRELAVRMTDDGQGVRAIKALVDGVKETTPGSIDLERFVWYSTEPKCISKEQEELLRSFVDSVSLKYLRLDVNISSKQVSSLFESVGLSQLEHLTLWTRSIDVESILDYLPYSSYFRSVTLINAKVTERQIEQLKSKGITLKAK